ncbi:MAG: hypothetical protein QM642_11460 [Edaphocola sp.]
MRNILTKILPISLLAAASFFGESSKAQVSPADVARYLKRRNDGKKVSLFHRYEVGYGQSFGGGNVSITNRYYDQSNYNQIGGKSRTTTFRYMSPSGYANIHIPMSYLSRKTILSASVGVFTQVNIFELGNTSLDENTTTSYDMGDAMVGLPLGIDVIWGGEATTDKADRVTLRAGAGVMPFLAFGSLASGEQQYVKLNARPYLKAEIGFFAGVEWKLRGSLIAGSRTIYDEKYGDYNLQTESYYSTFQMKITPIYNIGFTVFPFSFGWENSRW